MYLDEQHESIPRDYEKAEQIYRMALKQKADEKQVVLDRLERLEKLKAESR